MEQFSPVTLAEFSRHYPAHCKVISTQSERLYWTSMAETQDVCEAYGEDFYLAELDDAIIYNNSIIILPHLGLYISDATYPDSFSNTFFLEHFGIAKNRQLVVLKEPEFRGQLDVAFVVGGDNNHFHTLLNWYPRSVFATLVPKEFLPITALFNSNPIPQHRELIELIQKKIPINAMNANYNAFYKVSKLFLPSFVGKPYFSGFGVRFIQGLAESGLELKKITAKHRRKERLFITRQINGQMPKRMIGNQEELSTFLRGSYGFVEVDFEKMSFKEQVLLMRETSIFIAPQGAGVTNAMFCQPLTKAIMVENSQPSMMMFKMLHFFGMNFRMHQATDVVSPIESQLANFETRNRDMIVNIDEFRVTVDELVKQPDAVLGTRAPIELQMYVDQKIHRVF